MQELTEYVMIRQKILQQLLSGLSATLSNLISIEDIAQKSGYSRRNIQLLFRNSCMCLWENTFANQALSCRHSCPALAEIYA